MIKLLLKFADDTKLAQAIRGEEDRKLLQEALDALLEWAAKWGMSFNADKCKVMHVGRNNPCYTYKMGDHTLSQTDSERDIGILVNKSLKPSDQCVKAARAANVVLGQITRSFHYRDRKTFVKLYNMYVRPHLEFAVAAWSPWNQADIECLEKIQKRAINMVSGMGKLSYEERLRALNMTTLEERRTECDMVETYKILTESSPLDHRIWFDKNVAPAEGRVTRQAADPTSLRIPNARLDLRKNFFSVRVCAKWNALPIEVKQCKDVKKFKMAYKNYIKNRPPQATS